MARRAVFLDRDGTVIREANYLRSPRQLRLIRGAAQAIHRLNAAGFAVVITTNQSGVARGLITEADLAEIHAALTKRLARRGTRLDAICYCPHHPEATVAAYRRRCRCRKPAPGMLLRAARDLDLDLRASFAIGDSARDIEAGRRAGCRGVWVRTGHGAKAAALPAGEARPDYVADNLSEAVTWLLAQARNRPPATCKRP
jgi:D-glycero-D-manno-heptose 1,7-bisphosphate phosphatase